MDEFEVGLLAALILALAAWINLFVTSLIVTLPWPVEWAPIERACIYIELDIGCVVALAG